MIEATATGARTVARLARHVDGAVQVTLRRATPVGVELDVDVEDDGRVVLHHDGELIAEAESATLDLEVPPVPDVDATFAVAVREGATADHRGVHDSNGERAAWFIDPFGHRWGIRSPLHR